MNFATMDQEVLPTFLQIVHCGYCAKPMRRKNLKDHTSRCHKGQHPECAEGEALKKLLDELHMQQEKEKERKALERLAVANAKRLEKDRIKALEKEQEILQQKALEAHRKEQEQERKKKKRELLRLEKLQAKCIATSRDPSKPVSSSEPLNKTDKSSRDTFDQEAAKKNKTPSGQREATQDASGGENLIGMDLNVNESESTARMRSISESRRNISKKSHYENNSSVCRPVTHSDNVQGISKSTAPINPHGSPQSSSTFSSDHNFNAKGNEFSWQDTNFQITEFEMRRKFKDAKTMEEVLKYCPNFEYDEKLGSIKCVQCSSSKSTKPIHHQVKPDDSKSLQLAKFRDTKKKLLDHLYKSSMHASNAQSSSRQAQWDMNVECGTRVIRAIYGKLKTGGGYKSIEQTIAEKAADDLTVGDINHGRHFASSMTTPIYEAVKRRVQKSIKRVMPGIGCPPPFCLIADKMTPARSTLQIVGVISPSQETGKLQSICLGVKECYDGTGLGTTEEMVNCLKEYYSTEEINNSLVGVAVDGAYHHHNIKDHLPSVLDFSSEQKELLATSWDAAHLIELAAQKSRGQNSKDKVISTPWIKSTFDTVTSVKTFAGRGKNWKDLQDNTSLAVAKSMHDDGILQTARNKPLKKFQSFSNTRFARFSQRVLGNMRENFKATCEYLDSKSKEGSGLLNKLVRPDFTLRLCGLDDIYDHIGRASERLQSCRLYGWNTIEILEETKNSLDEMAASLRRGNHHVKMHQFNLAAAEVSTNSTYQGVPLQGQSSEANTELTLGKIREELADHIEIFTQDLHRRAEEHTPRICKLSREAFSLQRIMNRPVDFVPSEFEEIAELSTAARICDQTLTREDWHCEYTHFTRAVRAEQSALEIEGNCAPNMTGPNGTEEAIYSKFFTNKDATESFPHVSYLLCRSALQSCCEAVTEGMGSVVKKTLEGRENMSIQKLSQEVFVRLNGPKSNRNCDGILREAGDIRFGDRTKWHFVSSPKAKYKGTSKVLSRLSNEEDRFNFDSDTDDE